MTILIFLLKLKLFPRTHHQDNAERMDPTLCLFPVDYKQLIWPHLLIEKPQLKDENDCFGSGSDKFL